MCACEKNSIFIRVIIVTVLIALVFFPTCYVLHGVSKKNKTRKHVSSCIHVSAPLVIHKLRVRLLRRIIVARFSLTLSRNQDGGWERDEVAKKYREKRFIFIVLFSPPRNAIFIRDPGHLRVSRRDTWTLSHMSPSKAGSAILWPDRGGNERRWQTVRGDLSRLHYL